MSFSFTGTGSLLKEMYLSDWKAFRFKEGEGKRRVKGDDEWEEKSVRGMN